MKIKLPIGLARRLATKIVAELSDTCRRIEIAGSIRRDAVTVGDIELVAIPIVDSLFAGCPGKSRLTERLDQLVNQDRLVPMKRGDRFQQFGVPAMQGLQLDIFIVAPETWGVQLALRTGPADFSRALVTERSRGGRLPDGYAVHDGRVWAPGTFIRGMIDSANYRGPFFEPVGEPLDTPEECDFMHLAGGWFEPHERSVDLPIQETIATMGREG